MTTAVVMMTHRFDEPILAEFARMRQGLGERDQGFLLVDGAVTAPAMAGQRVHRFDFATLARRASRVIGDDILRNVHLAWIDFFEAHPGFDRYWFVEYDVRLAGPWGELLDATESLPHDLVCPHLRPFALEPRWFWWPEVQAPGRALAPRRLVRGFLPIARLSRAGLHRLRGAVDEGWSGFLEGLVPTALHEAGLSLADLGGEGPFAPAGVRRRFCTTAPADRGGSLVDRGTMRYRPPIAFPGIRSGLLYHPVKPETTVLDATSDPARLGPVALEQALSTLPRGSATERARALRVATGLDPVELLAALEEPAAAEWPGVAAARQELLALRDAARAEEPGGVRGLLRRLCGRGPAMPSGEGRLG